MTTLMAGPPEVLVSVEVSKRGPRWWHNPALVAGLVITGTVLILCVLAPVIAPYGPSTQDLENILASPSAKHWLGTDQLGRDVWTRLLYGGRVDLQVGFIAVAFPFVLGTILGSIAGYFGGIWDTLVMRLVDIVVAFPFFVLIIALVFVLGPGERSIYIAITVVGWVSYAKIIRGEILIAKRQDYVMAARVAGFSDTRIICVHILPNVITQAIIYAMVDVIQDILAIVTLSYLGLGIPPPTADWGAMISQGQQFLTTHWELSTIPGIAVVITGLGLSLIGDGLADSLSTDRS